jgi:hypothetical protein
VGGSDRGERSDGRVRDGGEVFGRLGDVADVDKLGGVGAMGGDGNLDADRTKGENEERAGQSRCLGASGEKGERRVESVKLPEKEKREEVRETDTSFISSSVLT